MGALFLAPDAALFWDTYRLRPAVVGLHPGPGGTPVCIGRGSRRAGSSYGAGREASLTGWQRLTDPSNRFGLIWINTSGSPTDFSIAGGPGRPADVPGGFPASVVMIHSFSAADPAAPGTLAGRWLAQGAFVYFGSVNEPLLVAFRRPGAGGRTGGRGDAPVGRTATGGIRAVRTPLAADLPGRSALPAVAGCPGRGPSGPRLLAGLDPSYAGWPAVEVVVPAAVPAPYAGHVAAGRLLEWCRDAAIVELARGPAPTPRVRAPPTGGRP